MDTLQTPATAVPSLASARRPALRSHLAGFGITGLVGLAVLAFWLLAALFGPLLLPQGRSAAGGGAVFAPISAMPARISVIPAFLIFKL